MSHNPASGLVSRLTAAGLLNQSEALQFARLAVQQQRPLTTLLVQQQRLTSEVLLSFCEQTYGLPRYQLDAFSVKQVPTRWLNPKLIEKHHALPLFSQGRTLYLALADPSNIAALEEFGFNFAMHTEPLLVDEVQLSRAIADLFEQQPLNHDLAAIADIDDEMIASISVVQPQDNADNIAPARDDAPIVKYIHKILLDAIKQGASDLHFEPYEQHYRIRFRIDGILYEAATPASHLAHRFAARLKVMARLDIAERRLPQDGRIKLQIASNKAIDMRVSTLPTQWGEKVVIRLLEATAARLDIAQLGFTEQQKECYLAALARPQGMILVTGPTGSGKTVTLYSGLQHLNTSEVNIASAEDPIEINLLGINQVQINPKTGLTFANALRAFLRQDPDIVMVGEIRDLETAEMAIKAAQTGHLVLSTLHTNSAADTLTRMLNMGVSAFNLTSAVTLIIAQRLVRKLCEHCKIPQVLPENQLLEQGFSHRQVDAGMTLYQAQGCCHCCAGFKGRIAIYEVLPITTAITQAMLQGQGAAQLTQIGLQHGMVDLRSVALAKASQGITSLAEVNRVTHHPDH